MARGFWLNKLTGRDMALFAFASWPVALRRQPYATDWRQMPIPEKLANFLVYLDPRRFAQAERKLDRVKGSVHFSQ